MKDINKLFKVIGKAVKQNSDNENNPHNPHWFINYSGHVNQLHIRYFKYGWSSSRAEENLFDSIEENLDANGIQSLYWFVKSKLE